MGLNAAAQSKTAPEDLPLASVVIACRNERAYIEGCLDSLMRSDYPRELLDILVVDGMSEDGTRECVLEFCKRFPEIRLIDNPLGVTPAAFNAGVRASRGKVVAIVGAHATYDQRYLVELIRHLLSYGADLVGAVAEYVPRQRTVTGRAIATVSSHRFGAGANVGYKVGASAPVWVDTVSSGCYRKDVFERIGFFNEELTYSQDIDFNSRLRRAGGRILLVPTAKITYFTRSDIGSFLRHTFRNGEWVVVPLAFSSHIPMSWHHFVPMAFVGTAIVAAASSPVWNWGWWLLIAVTGSYMLASLVASLHGAMRGKEPRFLFVLPIVFFALHVTYGFGSWWGVAELVRLRWQRRIAKQTNGQTDSI